ncbi:polysaccharide deacetylase family protein [Bacillus sp. FJAT-45350]|uniref:polysaccharide deacetylase family protein n=1 Tax=Bacillus sp. FJAT-45350 TaxID=2011014 RepID=UPI00211D113E|nr:polysaccharide deacetylase family protein [Bacillus sp. FJAT-45350]
MEIKRILILILSFVIISTACNNGAMEEEIVEETEQEFSIIEEPIIDERDEEEESVVTEEESSIEPLYELSSDWRVIPIEGTGANEKVVLLTIDDAPDKYGVEMAERLQSLGVGAIFFINGHFLQSDEGKSQLKQIYELGFEIGNHTMTHPNLSKLSEQEQRDEIIKLNVLIEEITGERPRFFRAPFGVNTDISKQVVGEEDMKWMNWSYGYDFVSEYMNAEALAEIMVNTDLLRPGSNLLMHDRDFTLEALEEIVEGLQEKGYEIVEPSLIK